MSEFAPFPLPSTGSAPSPRFTHQQTCVLHALASGFTPTEAAEQADVHRSQLYAWIDQPRFRISLENAQREHYNAIASRFHRLAVKAQNALEQIVDDPKCSPHARIKAANMILAHLERGQPALPRIAAETAAIDQQCRDENAPHIVIGRRIESATDPDAKLPIARQIQTETEPVAHPAAASATDPDAQIDPTPDKVGQIVTESIAETTGSATDPDAPIDSPRQIHTENAVKPANTRKNIYEGWRTIIASMLRHLELKQALLNECPTPLPEESIISKSARF